MANFSACDGVDVDGRGGGEVKREGWESPVLVLGCGGYRLGGGV